MTSAPKGVPSCGSENALFACFLCQKFDSPATMSCFSIAGSRDASKQGDVPAMSRERADFQEISDIAAFDLLGQGLDQLRHLFEMRIDRKCLAERIKRTPVVA